QPLAQFFAIGHIGGFATTEPQRNLFQRVGEVAVGVERLDQRPQRRAVLRRRRGGGAVLRFLVVVGTGAAADRARQLAPAVEVVDLAAVVPLAPLGEVGAVDAAAVVAGLEVAFIAFRGRALGRGLGKGLGRAGA